MEAPVTNDMGDIDARLRVMLDNGTESNLLMRWFQRPSDKTRPVGGLFEPSAGPLFADQSENGDEASGIVYVGSRQKPNIRRAAHRGVLHKIGVTGGDVRRHIANAKLDPTSLMAEVEIVATYELYNINQAGTENLIHRIFGAARLDIEIKDRFGKPVIPREIIWCRASLSTRLSSESGTARSRATHTTQRPPRCTRAGG